VWLIAEIKTELDLQELTHRRWSVAFKSFMWMTRRTWSGRPDRGQGQVDATRSQFQPIKDAAVLGPVKATGLAVRKHVCVLHNAVAARMVAPAPTEAVGHVVPPAGF
jgi:hypothetical protein